MARLTDTLEVMDRRKQAILGMREGEIEDPQRRAHVSSWQDMLRLLSGFDVDPNELLRVADAAAGMSAQSFLGGHDLYVVLASLWIDAFAVGMQHERRSRESDRADASSG